MMKHEDQPAEANLRAEREHAAGLEAARWASEHGMLMPPYCGHTEIYPTGHCADCGEEVEGFEPDDAQIPGAYEIQQAAA